jgi:exopolyphosphatase/guanosine-5'-triphosphate,3'-diphosphate pyrophosphatase
VDGVCSVLSGVPASSRAEIQGLNADRSDSIVGGALVVQAAMDRLLASDLIVAGYGLREGVALRAVTDEAASIEQVQSVGMAALGDRFSAYDAVRAAQRTELTRRVLTALKKGVPAETMLVATAAARLLDIGSSIDYYRRHAHSARIVCDANLDGFSHRILALIAASLYAVGEREATVKSYAPLVGQSEQPLVEQIAAAVGLADALVRYGKVDPGKISIERSNSHVRLATSLLDEWPLEAPIARAERAFGASISRVGEPIRVA